MHFLIGHSRWNSMPYPSILILRHEVQLSVSKSSGAIKQLYCHSCTGFTATSPPWLLCTLVIVTVNPGTALLGVTHTIIMFMLWYELCFNTVYWKPLSMIHWWSGKRLRDGSQVLKQPMKRFIPCSFYSVYGLRFYTIVLLSYQVSKHSYVLSE